MAISRSSFPWGEAVCRPPIKKRLRICDVTSDFVARRRVKEVTSLLTLAMRSSVLVVISCVLASRVVVKVFHRFWSLHFKRRKNSGRVNRERERLRFQLGRASPISFESVSGSFSMLESHWSFVGICRKSTRVFVDEVWGMSLLENTRASTARTCCSISFRNGKNESTTESNMPWAIQSLK